MSAPEVTAAIIVKAAIATFPQERRVGLLVSLILEEFDRETDEGRRDVLRGVVLDHIAFDPSQVKV